MPRNSITTQYRRQKLSEITSGAISTLAPIVQVAFGTGGAGVSGVPIPPAIQAVGLINEIARYDIKSVTYPLSPSTLARYTVVIPAAELVGAVISEAGLVDADGRICAIKTFNPMKFSLL